MNFRNSFSQLGKALLFATEYAQDIYYYARYCGISPFQNVEKKRYYKIIIETHAIEKGLSLANPRPFFGKEKIRHIIRMADKFGFHKDKLPITMAVGALQTYISRHRQLNLSDPLIDEIEIFLARQEPIAAGLGAGGLRIYPEGKPAITAEPEGLLLNRFSCRIFEAAPLSREEICHIVKLAQTAPSQCNRQATRVHYYDDPPTVQALLKLQGGSAGFNKEVPGLFAISFDLAAWGGAQQRNQGYVDGSLFAMALMLSAQAHGAVTCPLNLAVRHKTERQIRSVGNIPSDQRLVMMIAIGNASRENLRAAASPRRPLVEILNIAGRPSIIGEGEI